MEFGQRVVSDMLLSYALTGAVMIGQPEANTVANDDSMSRREVQLWTAAKLLLCPYHRAGRLCCSGLRWLRVDKLPCTAFVRTHESTPGRDHQDQRLS